LESKELKIEDLFGEINDASFNELLIKSSGKDLSMKRPSVCKSLFSKIRLDSCMCLFLLVLILINTLPIKKVFVSLQYERRITILYDERGD
jgi:hypothetical protein